MKNLRTRFERFCFKHRQKGIPNLMLYIVLGNALVYLISMISEDFSLYDILCFDRALILRGQVWRLVSFVFTSFSSSSSLLLLFISYLCYFSLGRAMENSWGTLRFNLFYLSGVILMDIFAMAFGGIQIAQGTYLYDFSGIYSSMGHYLNLSLFLGYATLAAKAEAGDVSGAIRDLRDYWGGMLDEGADTFWELYNPENPNESPYGGTIVNSYCHAWSCAPAYYLRKYF